MSLQLPDDLCTAAQQRAGVGLLPQVIEKLPTADRLVELYDGATADYDLPLSSRSEDVSRPVCFP